MSEATQDTAATSTTKAAKKEIVYREVAMQDGRTIKFAGTRRVDVDVSVKADTGETIVRWDFDDGSVRTLSSKDLPVETALYALGHGVKQKTADAYADSKDATTGDIVIAVEEMFTRLKSGDWFTARQPGDSTAGASVVIRAIVEAQIARGKTDFTIDKAKAYLDGKLAADKAAGGKLTRQGLYASFRSLATPTGVIIKRLEEEAAAKKAGSSGIDATSLLDDMAA